MRRIDSPRGGRRGGTFQRGAKLDQIDQVATLGLLDKHSPTRPVDDQAFTLQLADCLANGNQAGADFSSQRGRIKSLARCEQATGHLVPDVAIGAFS